MFFDFDFKRYRRRLGRFGLVSFVAALTVSVATGQGGLAQETALDPKPDPVLPVAPEVAVLPAFCENSGLTPEACLDVLAGLSLDQYCADKRIAPADCAGFLAAYRLPDICVNASLTVLGCADELARNLRSGRVQARNLLNRNRELSDQIKDLTVPDPEPREDLTEQIARLTAEKAELESQVGALTGQVDVLTDQADVLAGRVALLTGQADILSAELDAAKVTIEDQKVSVVDVCRAAAGRLDGPAREALGPDAPKLDQKACAANPIAEISRFVAALPAGTVSVAALAAKQPVQTGLTDPAGLGPDADCAVRPTPQELTDFVQSEPSVFGLLDQGQVDLLVQDLAKGLPGQEVVNAVWPEGFEAVGLSFVAVDLLCTRFPATCAAQNGLALCE